MIVKRFSNFRQSFDKDFKGMERLKVSQIAQSLGVSNQTVYNYLGRFGRELEGNLIKTGGKTYLSEDGFKILKTCLGKPEPVETVNGFQNLESLILGLKETIDTLLRQQAEERQRNAEERQRSDTIILKLTNDIGTLQKALEYRNPDTAVTPTGKESRDSSKSQDRRADPRRVVSPPVEKREPVQRELSLWESVQLTINDFTGFLFGRG